MIGKTKIDAFFANINLIAKQTRNRMDNGVDA